MKVGAMVASKGALNNRVALWHRFAPGNPRNVVENPSDRRLERISGHVGKMWPPPRIENGHLIMPTKPGWGADINEDAVRRHPPK